MACASPNQWAMTPTSSSSRSSLRQDEADDVEEPSDALLDHVRQLIADLMTDRHSSSLRLSDAAAETGSRDAKHGNNPEAEDDAAATARERLLEDKLAHVLVELAAEQDNLRLAANAGNALLEELAAAREDVDVLHDELEAAQLARDRSAREGQRLRDQNAALEAELQRYDVPWDPTGQQNALSHHQQLQQRRPSLSSRSGSFSRADSCERCASREVEATQLSQRADELRRRCMELELARERDQQRERELGEELAQLQLQRHEQQLETSRVQHDLEFATTQLAQRAQEVESVQAVRDTLRRTARRLEAENDELRARLAARDELVDKLESSRARAATQLQVAENRAKSAEAETKRATETLQQLQTQLENALAQKQQRGQSSARRGEDDAEVEPLEKEARDMEQLLQDAAREVAALRLENRVLRRQSSFEAATDKCVRGRRRKTVCTDSAAVTAADVLALAAASSASDSGSDTTLPPLELETLKLHAHDQRGNALDATPEDGKKRRIVALELKWVDEAATDAAATDKKPKAPSEPLESGELQPERTKKNRGVEVDAGASSAERPSAFTRANEHCVSSGAAAVDSPAVRLYGVEGKRAARRSAGGGIRARDLPIEELKREAVETPPNSPLYLGLSFIACATAATAAGLLARR
jgi:hypothetical protein